MRRLFHLKLRNNIKIKQFLQLSKTVQLPLKSIKFVIFIIKNLILIFCYLIIVVKLCVFFRSIEIIANATFFKRCRKNF